jgi:hypothetical protein
VLQLGDCGLQLCCGGLCDCSGSNSVRKRPDFVDTFVDLV